MRRVSLTGLALCLPYAAAIALCLWGAHDAGGDDKGRFVLLQLPIALQSAALHALGLSRWLHGMSWTIAYLLLVPPMFAGGYLLGHALEAGVRRIRTGAARQPG